MDEQYDVSKKMKELFLKKQKQRAEAKEYFQKLIYNPYRPIEQGTIIHPSMVRYHSLRTYSYEFVSPTPSYFFKLFIILSPIALCAYGLHSLKLSKEKRFRSGELKYEDRFNQYYLF